MNVKCPHCNNIIIIVNANNNNANNNANNNNANKMNNRKNAIYKEGLNRLIHENYEYS